MVDSNTVIVEKSPHAANTNSEKTTNSPSPDIQEINEDIRQAHKIYHFQNCGTVYMSVDSFNARGVRMENCGNNVPQVTCSLFFFPFPFSSNLAISYYYSDNRPRIIGNEKVLHSQSHAVTNGMWALGPSPIKHVEYVLPPLGLQNETGSPTTSKEITKSNHSNVHLQMNALPPPQYPQPISSSHFSGDPHHNIKYLEQLLDSSLATAAVIQFSGSTLPDVLTPRAYDTFKALYALAALDAPTSSTNLKSKGSEIPTCSTSSDIGNDCPNRSPPLPNSSLAVPRTGRIHISISVDYVMLLSRGARLAVVFCFVFLFFNLSHM